MKFNVFVGKGARGRFNKVATISGPAAQGFATLHAAMVRTEGFRTKVEPA